ncbi:unnamed protein product, partial [Aureobasidium vineae]
RLSLEILHAVLELVILYVGGERWLHSEPRYHSVVLVCRDWAEIASNIWWKTRRYLVPEAEAPLATLARLPLKRQQWYANKIQHLNLNETNARDFIVALELDFPFLRTLEVTRWSDYEVGFVCLASQSIRRSLLELKLTRTYRTDDILTGLLNAPNLRTLELWCESSDATSDKVLNVMETCFQLRALELTFSIGALITKDVLAAIASLPITHLKLGEFHSTAIDLLGGIVTLTSLSLGVIGTAPIFRILATLRNLQNLKLCFRDAVAIEYSERKCLARLKELHSISIFSWDGFGFSQVDLSSITLDEFTSFFHALPRLSCFRINAAISNTAQLYIKAEEMCRSIESLGLRGQFDSELFLKSHTGNVLVYPMLESLWVHQFIEPQDKRTWDERVHNAALELHKAARELWVLHGGTQRDEGYGDDGLGPFVTERDDFTACVEARHRSIREQERRKYLDEKYGKNRRSGMPIGTYV